MKLPAGRRLIPWLLTVMVGVVIFWQQRYVNRSRPERLLELPLNTEVMKVQNGQIYAWVYDIPKAQANQTAVKYITRPGSTRKIPVMVEPADTNSSASSRPVAIGVAQHGVMPGMVTDRKTLIAFPVTGGKSREVGLDTVEAADTNTLWSTDIGTVQAYILPPPPQPSRLQGVIGVPSSDKYVPPPAPKPPFHIHIWKAPADDLTLIVRSARKGENTFTKLRTLFAGKLARGTDINLHYSVAVAGGWLYWIQYAPTEGRLRVSSDGQYTSLASIPHCSVMAVPLQGGTPKKISGDLFDNSMLVSGTNGVLCLTPISGPPDSKKITFLSATDPAHEIPGVHDLIWSRGSDFLPPIRSDGWIFWIEKNGSVGKLARADDQPLVRTREDSSEAPTAVQLPLSATINSWIIDLVEHNRRLYVRMLEQSKHESNAVGTGHYTIYLLRNGAKPTFDKVCQEPNGTNFSWYDGDYLYCVAMENQENLSDFSPSGLIGKSVRVVYRYPLPK